MNGIKMNEFCVFANSQQPEAGSDFARDTKAK